VKRRESFRPFQSPELHPAVAGRWAWRWCAFILCRAGVAVVLVCSPGHGLALAGPAATPPALAHLSSADRPPPEAVPGARRAMSIPQPGLQ